MGIFDKMCLYVLISLPNTAPTHYVVSVSLCFSRAYCPSRIVIIYRLSTDGVTEDGPAVCSVIPGTGT